ncbi:MAG: elongation factor G [Carboxydocellales bacterium]
MQVYPSEALRNVGIVGHSGVGKTTLIEGMLFASGAIARPGKVEDGNTVGDFLPEEIARQVTISSALIPVEWSGKKLNILDSPGYSDFLGEIEGTMRVVDGTLFVLCAASGVQVQTEVIWEKVEGAGLPRLVFINKLERENADYFRTLEQLKQHFPQSRFIPCQLPIGQGGDFSGFYDLLADQVFTVNSTISKEIPKEIEAIKEKYREQIIETAVEADDELLSRYLEGETINPTEIVNGLAAGFRANTLVPVFLGSATLGTGTRRLLDILVDFLPSPCLEQAAKQSSAAYVFKTTVDPYVGKVSLLKVLSGSLKPEYQLYNLNKGHQERVSGLFSIRGKHQQPLSQGMPGDLIALNKLAQSSTGDTLSQLPQGEALPPLEFAQPIFSLALIPKTKNDDDKLGTALVRLVEEDPSLQVERNVETKQVLLKGMGELHLEINIEKLKRKFGVQVETCAPKVPYRETIRKDIKIEGKHKKQTGGHGQYGHVWLNLGPSKIADLEFSEEIFGGSVPRQYIPAVEKGLREAMLEGVLAGFPVTGIRAVLIDGSYHNVDSSEMAFKLAASLAFRKGVMQAQPVLLEPIMQIEITVPDSMMGDIISDLNGRRGKILGMEPMGNKEIIKAMVPEAELLNYAIALRSISQGRGSFTMTFDHYDEIPSKLAETIISKVKVDKTS